MTATPAHARTKTPKPTATVSPHPTRSPQPTAVVSRTAAAATQTVVPTRTTIPTRTRTAIPNGTPVPTPTPWIAGYNNCADVTGDGRVTLRDANFVAFMIRFGNHRARYDVNRDGKVNYWDLLLVVRQLGTRCTR
jgi:Dockerin type I domain